MLKPLAICIEDLDSPSATKYIRCVALPGRQPGLRVDRAGRILWQDDAAVACELWVSADERLMLYRPADMDPITLHRAGRSLSVPFTKPVVVIDQDQIDVGVHHFKIHLHGKAQAIAPPSALPTRPEAHRHWPLITRAAVALGAVATAVGCFGKQEFDVREAPPAAEEPAVTEPGTSLTMTLTLPVTAPSESVLNLPNTAVVDSIATIVIANDNLGTFAKALEKTGLDKTLVDGGPYTLLAPTDAAFAALLHSSKLTQDQLFQSQELTAILQHHILLGEVKVANITDGLTVKTLAGRSVTFTVKDDQIHVEGSGMISTDILATNGVVHVIDAVMRSSDQ